MVVVHEFMRKQYFAALCSGTHGCLRENWLKVSNYLELSALEIGLDNFISLWSNRDTHWSILWVCLNSSIRLWIVCYFLPNFEADDLFTVGCFCFALIQLIHVSHPQLHTETKGYTKQLKLHRKSHLPENTVNNSVDFEK